MDNLCGHNVLIFSDRVKQTDEGLVRWQIALTSPEDLSNSFHGSDVLVNYAN